MDATQSRATWLQRRLGLSRTHCAVAEQEAAIDIELVAARVAAEFIVIVENENARVRSRPAQIVGAGESAKARSNHTTS